MSDDKPFFSKPLLEDDLVKRIKNEPFYPITPVRDPDTSRKMLLDFILNSPRSVSLEELEEYSRREYLSFGPHVEKILEHFEENGLIEKHVYVVKVSYSKP